MKCSYELYECAIFLVTNPKLVYSHHVLWGILEFHGKYAEVPKSCSNNLNKFSKGSVSPLLYAVEYISPISVSWKINGDLWDHLAVSVSVSRNNFSRRVTLRRQRYSCRLLRTSSLKRELEIRSTGVRWDGSCWSTARQTIFVDNKYTRNNIRTVGRVVFCAVHVVSNNQLSSTMIVGNYFFPEFLAFVKSGH
jgi:hypothetical protein